MGWTSVVLLGATGALLSAFAGPDVSITVKDLTPKFLAFYRSASKQGVTADERFRLWKADYGFAAVPPGPEGEAIARKLLDEAWDKYPAVLSRIEVGAAGLRPRPEQTLRRVASLLGDRQPVHITLIVYVGALEGNAFTVGEHGRATVALPVEDPPAMLGPAMTHEFVHAVQISMGVMSGGWERTVGETALAEGFAMRATQALYPGRPATAFVETPDEPGWLAKSQAHRLSILKDVRAALSSSTSADVMRFTMGVGPSGEDREAYFAGWEVVGYWLKHGRSFADIARIPEARAPEEVGRALSEIIARQNAATASRQGQSGAPGARDGSGDQPL